MNESELEKIYNYPIYPRDSKIHLDKGFVIIDDCRMGGTDWTFYVKKINHITLTGLVELQINFYLINYRNQ